MRDSLEPKLAKWPFLFGDLLMLGAAWFIYWESTRPMGLWQIGFIVICVAGGACLSILPFLLEYRVQAKVAEAQGLTSVVEQLNKLETLAGQISGASSQWQNVHEEAGKTAASAKWLAERMGAEVKAFTEFMQKVNDGERATLRLELDKVKRNENEWLQVTVRMLDHVYALYLAGVHSGQPRLVEQLNHFQNACRDAARRVGLTPFSAAAAERFDSQKHQLADPKAQAPEGAVVAETVATGYSFQGRLLRPALVRLQAAGQGPTEPNGSKVLPESVERGIKPAASQPELLG